MKTINIKGSEYVTVNERLKYFRSSEEFKGWSIQEDVMTIDDKEGIFKVTIRNANETIIAEAHSQEYRDSSYINKTSFLENGFTSALGRALGYLGIGIDAGIPSAIEMQNAVNNQVEENDDRPWLNEQQLKSTLEGTTEQAKTVMSKFRMKNTYREQIKQKFGL